MAEGYTKHHPFIDAMIKKHGGAELARRMGLSTGTINQALAEEEKGKNEGVRLAYELAAKQLFSDEQPKADKTTLFMVQVPPDQHETVKAMLTGIAALGVKYSEFKF